MTNGFLTRLFSKFTAPETHNRKSRNQALIINSTANFVGLAFLIAVIGRSFFDVSLATAVGHFIVIMMMILLKFVNNKGKTNLAGYILIYSLIPLVTVGIIFGGGFNDISL